MPIKILNLNLAIPIEEFLVFAAQRSTSLRIDVLSDSKPMSRAALKQLEGPRAGKQRMLGHVRNAKAQGEDGKSTTAIAEIMKLMAAKPTHATNSVELRALMPKLNLMASSANSQTYIMRKRGLLKKIGEGEYKLTPQGLRECLKLGYTVAQADAKPPKPPKKPNGKAPVKEEVQHG